MIQSIRVLKRDSSMEAFDPGKIARVLQVAGLENIQANLLAKNVCKWVYNLNLDQIPSLQIRQKVIEELRKVNQSVADFYAWYENTKER